jgi:hypothetical protein
MNPDDALDVDLLLERVASVSNFGYWADNNPYEHVRGKVSLVSKPHYGKVYVTLSGDKGKLKLVCPEHSAPAVGQHIICKGVIEQKFSEFVGGIEVQIKGDPIGEWEPKGYEFKSNISLNKNTHRPLFSFLEEFSVSDLLFLGSETGIKDAVSQMGNHESETLSHQINVSDSNRILSDLKSVISSGLNAKGVAIVRGGDDDSIDQWDDPAVVDAFIALDVPFYVAIGHSHRVTLLDKYADQSFSTPSSLGLAVGEISLQQKVLVELKSESESARLESEKAKIDKAIAEKHAEAVDKKNRVLSGENFRFRRESETNKNEALRDKPSEGKTLTVLKSFCSGLAVASLVYLYLNFS